MDKTNDWIKCAEGYVLKAEVFAIFISTGSEDFAVMIQYNGGQEIKYKTISTHDGAKTELDLLFHLLTASE